MTEIIDVRLYEILDSRGYPTVAAEITLAAGSKGWASVPSGASVGTYEAVEKRDGDKNYYLGKGVKDAIYEGRHEIFSAISGLDATAQRNIDQVLCALDGTENKSRLGGNIILAVSLAVARAASHAVKTNFYRYLGGVDAHILPAPMLNIINGGKHADNSLNIQEFMIMPLKASSFSDALRMGSEIYHHLRVLLGQAGYSVNLGDEGGFAPALSSSDEALEIMMKAVEKAGYRPEEEVLFALDCAANEFFDSKTHCYTPEDKACSSGEMVDYLEGITKKWPVFSIEDGMAEDDYEGWSMLTDRIGDRIQLVGDDFFVTNSKRLQRGIENGQANALLVKPNQIGTLSETFEAIHMAQHNGYRAVMSHRSGETEDTSIADLAVATHCGQIKTGAVARTERTAKYNRLLRIEQDLGDNAHYAGNALIAAYHAKK